MVTTRMAAPNLQEQRTFVYFKGTERVWYLVEEPATLESAETPPGSQSPAPLLLWFPLSLIPCGYSSLCW